MVPCKSSQNILYGKNIMSRWPSSSIWSQSSSYSNSHLFLYHSTWQCDNLGFRKLYTLIANHYYTFVQKDIIWRRHNSCHLPRHICKMLYLKGYKCNVCLKTTINCKTTFYEFWNTSFNVSQYILTQRRKCRFTCSP